MRYPLMPTGVEHDDGSDRKRPTYSMRYPLMPTGVEHRHPHRATLDLYECVTL